MNDKALSGPASPIGFYKDPQGRLIPTPLMCDKDGYLLFGGSSTKDGKTTGLVSIGGVASPELSSDVNGTIPDGEEVPVGSSSVASQPIIGTLVDITFELVSGGTDRGCFIEIGKAPVAKVGSYYIVAGVTYRESITSGNAVAALQIAQGAVNGGKLYIHPVE